MDRSLRACILAAETPKCHLRKGMVSDRNDKPKIENIYRKNVTDKIENTLCCGGLVSEM